jgi:hypothetical protein
MTDQVFYGAHRLLSRKTNPIMKTTALYLAAMLVLPFSLAHAKSAASTPSLSFGGQVATLSTSAPADVVSSPALSGRGSDFAAGLHQTTSTASFADLNATSKSIPLPPTWMIALMISALVLAGRIFGLKHARAMADHERDMHLAKAKMYRTLHDR